MANNERVVNGIKTRVLHGKDYVEVAERVRVVHELKKKVEMMESVPFQVGDRCLWRVVIKVDDLPYIGNAEVKLNAPKNSPDGTNPFECAETSALGRALAFAGLGTVESIASYDEIMRGQPFVAVVEQPQKRIVEAQNSPRQIEQAQSLSSGSDAVKSRLNAFYARAKAIGVAANAQEFLAFIGHELGIEVVEPAMLTPDNLDDVEAKIALREQKAS